MSFAGFKKQLNKANQLVSEKIGGAKGTELDEDYVAMEKKVDVMDKLVTDVMKHTEEYLQPNPASRAKLMTQNVWSKVRGQATNASYPQPEGTLGETLLKHGQELGDDYGQSCVAVGEAFKQLADAKYALEGQVKQNFLDPLLQLQSKDLKEIGHHRKKLEGRRLDYDCKRRKRDKGGSGLDDAELRMAEEKFGESKELTEQAMHNLLSNDAEQISQLNAFVQAVLDYHREAADILESVCSSISDRAVTSANKPRPEHVPKRVLATSHGDRDSMCSDDSSVGGGSAASSDQGKAGSYSFSSTPARTAAVAAVPSQARPPVSAPQLSTPIDRPCVKALYDFDPENEGELGFKEGDMIELRAQIDENWFEGRVRGNAGFFPISYVKVVVPL